MDLFNFVIVGSGPAGVAAARVLEKNGTCIVDVGEKQEQEFPYKSLYEGLATGDLKSILGERWEMLANLVETGSVHAKLRAAGVRYVANGQVFSVNNGAGNTYLKCAGSYASGGMSNAWGAQLLRYTDADLHDVGDWPIRTDVLDSYYSDLEAHIGIAGTADDMYDFLGKATNMLPPAPIVPAANYLLKKYHARRNGSRLRLGRARLAILTQSFRGYPAHEFNELEFLTTQQPGIYTARRTLEEVFARGRIVYLGGHELISYHEHPEFVELELRERESNSARTIRAKHLLLGCGTVQTARLVLLNQGVAGFSLPFIDHPPTLVPLIIPRMFGAGLPTRSFPVQLVATIDDDRPHDMISFYYPGALLWSDLLPDIPLPINAALNVLPNLLCGFLVAQIWEPSMPSPNHRLKVDYSGTVQIEYPKPPPYSRLSRLLKELKHLGAYSIQRLATSSIPGWGFHYAACLPMRNIPGKFETHVDGRLWDSKRVRVIDGCVLPSLPAKNHSLTLMANAARIADEALKCEF